MRGSEKATILVTGAAGKTGRAVVRTLARRGMRARALVFRERQATGIQALGATEVVVGDLRSRDDLERAVDGIRALYHICPNVHPQEVEIGEQAIATAIAAGVEHFVYHSVLLPRAPEMPHHWLKHRVEERLEASGLAYAILQPCAYMQNVMAEWGSIVNGGVFRVPYGVHTKMSLVDLADVADAAAEVLAGTVRPGVAFELCGPEPVSPVDVAAAFQRCLDRPVRAETMEVGAWEANARVMGMGEYQIDALVRMFRYYDEEGFVGDPRPLAALLGRPANNLAAFLERSIREVRTGS